MIKQFVLGVALTALAAAPVFAGGYVTPVIAVGPAVAASPAPTGWSGGYIGMHIGYGDGSVEDVNNPRASKHDTDGFIGGIQVGYNWQFANRVVLGVEADLSASNVKAKWTDVAYYGEDGQKLAGSIRGRIGYAYDRFLPYLHGGFAWSKNDHMLGCNHRPVHGSSCESTSFETKKSDTVTGYTIGAGLEYAIDQRWSVKGEYAYTNYGENKLLIVDPNSSTSPVNNRNFETENHSIKFGVNYRF